jgi:uncharacterized protein
LIINLKSVVKTVVKIDGMHCKSCEVMLEERLGQVKGVSRCFVSHKSGKAELTCDEAVPHKEIVKAVEQAGYRVVEANEPEQKKRGLAWMDYAEIGSIALLVGVVALILSQLGLAKFMPNTQGAVSPAISWLVGLVASLSTCMALIGGIVLSFSEAFPISSDARHPWLGKAKPHLLFHAGRIGGFILLGGILGAVGKGIGLSLSTSGWLILLVSILMLCIGLQTLGILPSLSSLGFALPNGISKKAWKLRNSRHPLMPVVLGVLTFFVPCGFTQAMQLASVASGSFGAGALTMGAFALGTFPVLMLIGFGSTAIREGKVEILNRVIGVVLVFFAFYSMNSGLLLVGSPWSFSSVQNTESAKASVPTDGVQVVKMDVNWGYAPNQFKIKKGVPVRWEINGVNVSGCANSITIPRLGVFKNLQPGQNIIEFTPTESGTLPFSCGMGMLNGRFIVE